MLDVLITVSETTPHNFVNECRRSVRVAADLASYQVNVIEVPGVPGHIGQAMLNGLARSTAPYVAWVDDDDFVLPNAFSCLEHHFDARPSAICAREIRLLANGRLIPTEGRHHLSAWSRDVLDASDLASCPARPYAPVFKEAMRGTITDELSWVYVYRIRLSAALQLRAQHRDQQYGRP